MYILGMIDWAGYGTEWFLGNDGYWHRRHDVFDGGFKTFEAEDDAVDYAWSHEEVRRFGGQYFGEELAIVNKR